ncbi:MAG: hypothetical protein AAF806_20990 [Bacteroidota bacterium]
MTSTHRKAWSARNINNIVNENKDFIEDILGVVSTVSRRWLLYGKFLIGALQSEDPDINFSKVGGEKPFWNDDEWFDEDRRNKLSPSEFDDSELELL